MEAIAMLRFTRNSTGSWSRHLVSVYEVKPRSIAVRRVWQQFSRAYS